MTYADFLVRLRETPRTWYLRGGLIRIDLADRSCCPITAVADQPVYADRYPFIATWLGLKDLLAMQIVAAADDPACPIQEIRRDLLDACGLTETIR